MKFFRKLIFVLLLPFQAFAGNGFFEGDILITKAGWDYSPSFMVDQWDSNKEKIWWCGRSASADTLSTYNSLGVPGNYYKDQIWYAERPAGGSWSAPQVVLSNMGGAFNSWENSWPCDPTVLRGSWVHMGVTYSYAMYYTTGPSTTDMGPPPYEGNNRVLLAFSNDGKNWVKYGSVVNTNFPPGSNYGAGQAQARSTDGGAGVMLFYTDVDSTGLPHYYVRTAADGRTFSNPQEISYSGLPATRSYRNPAAAFAPSTNGWYYLAIVDVTSDGTFWGEAVGISVYRISSANLYSGTWTKVVTPGNVRAAMAEPGFRTDAYGYITTLPAITIYAACDNIVGSPGTWDLCWASANVP